MWSNHIYVIMADVPKRAMIITDQNRAAGYEQMIDWQSARRMNAEEYRETIDRLDMNVAQAGRLLGVSPRTAARYAHGETDIPEGFVLLLRLLIAFNITPVVPKWRKP